MPLPIQKLNDAIRFPRGELMVRATSEYEKMSAGETLNVLETSADGLTEAEAGKRLETFGYNEVTPIKKNPILEFLSRYWGPMPWLLELAMALSLGLGHPLEGIIIFSLLTINAGIGYLHSRGSEKAVQLLKKKLAVTAKLLRNSIWVSKEAREVVPGDILSVRLGDIVPADAKMISGELLVDRSSLTGESLPISALPSDILSGGSMVKRGAGRCVVLNTGGNTLFGRTAELLKIARPPSHQQEVMMSIVKYMMYLGIAASIMVSIDAILLKTDILIILTFVVIFLMGAVPVALPAVLTIVQAVGATELAKRGALVTRLDSIEDAASIDILCLDKTGTITQNRLSVTGIVTFSGYEKKDVAAIARLASREEEMDLIDLAVIEYVKTLGMCLESFRPLSFTPFNSLIKRTEGIIEAGVGRFKAVKGASEIVISLCRGITPEMLEKVKEAIEDLSQKGYKVLAVARSEGDSLDNLKLAGLLSLSDPPRADSKQMIEDARKFGIKPIMLTGDNRAIAREIARQAGVGTRIIRMGDLGGLSTEEKLKRITENDGVAEIYPEDKYEIVRLLQSGGHMVGMTGDGVNDAPALKQAEMGIAVSNSTDVAKASASVVLTEPGLSVIIDGVRISRETYQRMLSWVINKVTKVIEVVGVLTLGFFWFHEMVLSLLGMSLLVFANDFVTMALATDNVKETSNPNHWNVKSITFASLIPGLLLVVEGMIVLWLGARYFRLDFERLRTLVMLNFILNSQFRIWIVRERRHFWSSMPGKELLILSTATIAIFILLALYGPFFPSLSLYQIAFVLGFSMLFTLGIDFPKYYLFKKFEL
ncbi:MAG: plasma-membrane proton-efflux P-type ATPase [Nitrospiria bacterium]